VRFESIAGRGDDTAANGLKVTYCRLGNWETQKPNVLIHAGLWGTWRGIKMCPENHYVDGAQVRFEDRGFLGLGDNTALNGLRIHCQSWPDSTSTLWVTVWGGNWGSWKSEITRSDKFVKLAKVCFQDSQGRGDDTAWNGLKFLYDPVIKASQIGTITEASDSYAVYINVGGLLDYTDIYGTIWAGHEKAASYSSGVPYSISNSTVINATDKEGLYRSELFFSQKESDDPPMVFEVPIPPGEYIVHLHFVEIWKYAQREDHHLFDVFIEDTLVWKDLDIYKEAEGGYTALVKESETTVADCWLTVKFKSIKQSPQLSAIEITPKQTCIIATVDFNIKADGTPLEPGLYVGDEWLEFGMVVWASGGVSELPRLFDTSKPRPKLGCGDPDLGAPNKGCSPPGPGIGAGGAPGKPGENCDKLGNVLIIQEDNDGDCPDDNRRGGTIAFDFVEPALAVYEMGFLNTDDGTSVKVLHIMDENITKTVLDLPVYGRNSKQTLKINIENVTLFKKSGAVTHIKFCHYDKNITKAIAAAQLECLNEIPTELTTPNPQTSDDSLHEARARSVGMP